jgi:hypothetical protein
MTGAALSCARTCGVSWMRCACAIGWPEASACCGTTTVATLRLTYVTFVTLVVL